jgi:hypothetical protein
MSSRFALTLLAAAVVTFATAAVSEELAEPVSVRVELADHIGQKISNPQHRNAFSIRVTLTDVITGKLSNVAEVTGWLRPVLPGQPSCRDAARNQRITQSIPRGDVSLAGKWLVTLDRNNRLSVIDAAAASTRSLIAVKPLPETPAAVRIDESANLILAALPKTGKLAAYRLPGLEPAGPDAQLDNPFDALPARDSGWWVADTSKLTLLKVSMSGVERSISLNGTPLGLFRIGPDKIAAVMDNSIAIIDEKANSQIASVPKPARIGALWSELANAFLWVDPESKEMVAAYADTPGSTNHYKVNLTNPEIAVAPPGRFAFMWSRNDPRIEVRDLSTGQLRASGAFGQPATEVRFGGGFAFILLQDKSTVVVAELVTLAEEGEIGWREIRTGLGEEPSTDVFPQLATVASDPSAMLLRTNAGNGAALEINAGETALAAPMRSHAIKSGEPVGVWLVNRGFERKSRGIFEAVASVQTPGAYELVVTDGIYGFVNCSRIDVGGKDMATKAQPVPVLRLAQRLEVPEAGRSTALNLQLVDLETGENYTLMNGAAITAYSLVQPWRSTATADIGTDGAARADFTFPEAGTYAVIVSNIPGVREEEIRPLVLDVR